jgi:lipid-binding SYLF domain-containing protein
LDESSEESIPTSLLRNGDGVVILPGMLSVGWGIGLSHGTGIMLFRKNKIWNNPVFVSMSGASFGYQIGAQSSDVILSFKRPNTINSLLDGTITLGVDAAIAAGPIGRDTTLATDATLDTEIYSWSRSRGLFAGVALDGSALSVDEEANAEFYKQPGITAEDIIKQAPDNRSSGLRRLKSLLNQHIGVSNE